MIYLDENPLTVEDFNAYKFNKEILVMFLIEAI